MYTSIAGITKKDHTYQEESLVYISFKLPIKLKQKNKISRILLF